ncbi:asparaginase [Timonella sp. A28]|uniref:asparaginase n=1 Tax=Timonella sp. A28 TaxID=3442640 RepID=UPI003EB739E7
MFTEIPSHQPLVSVSRGAVIESVHYGSAIVIDSHDTVISRLGNPAAPMYARSSLKPLQALAMVRAGFQGTAEQITLACASHSGEDFHINTVHSILNAYDLDESALLNTPDLPIGVAARNDALKGDVQPEPILQNCSGKHAAMLATCIENKWDTRTYLDPDHPLQQLIRQTIEEVTGEEISGITVDGCGAPLFYLSLEGVARGFKHIATTAVTHPDSAEGLIYNSIITAPQYLGGTDRDVTDMMTAFPGLMTKDGAEGVHVGAFGDGSVFAIKVSDGGQRGRVAATLRALELLGYCDDDLQAKHLPKVLGHGEVVGEVKALL